jgi:hypothetical protein
MARQRSRQKADLLAFERDMAAALGAWDRWVEASARHLQSKAQEVAQDGWAAVKRAFQIDED